MTPVQKAILAFFAAGAPYVPPAGEIRWSTLSLTAEGDITFPAGTSILMDKNMLDSERVGHITLSGGKMRFDINSPRLLCKSITVTAGGELNLGTEAAPYSGEGGFIHFWSPPPTVSGNAGGGPLIRGYTHDLTTDVATGNNGTANDYGGINRGLINDGGKVAMYCARPLINARMSAAYTSGNTITIDQPITMPQGSTVLVSPDGFFDAAKRTEVRTLAVAAVNDTILTLNAPLSFARFGRNQYMTDNGMSLTADPFTLKTGGNPNGMKTDAGQTALVKSAAFVVIAKPNFIIDAYDIAGQNHISASGFGWHGMTMQLTSFTYIKNVGFNNYGQLGLLGRYGWHFHVPSYNSNGTNKTTGYLGTNQWVPGTAVIDGVFGNKGHNRFGVHHASVGSVIKNCVSYRSKGHPFLMEDGSERLCEFSSNLAIGFEDPGPGNRLKFHDEVRGTDSLGLVGYWLSNPENTVTNNWSCDSDGGPWWNAHSFGLFGAQVSPQHGCVGFSANVPINPGFGKMGVWDGNSGLCCNTLHASNNGVTRNNGKREQGVEKLKITTDGQYFGGFSSPNEVINGMLLQNAQFIKCIGYSNAVSSPNYRFWKCVDLLRISFSGITNSGAAHFPILIRQSLNHESNYLATIRTMGFAAYHGTMSFIGVCADGFSGNAYTTDGGNGGAVQNIAVQETWEEYTGPIHDFPVVNTGWALRNSRAIWQTPPSHLTEDTTTYDYITGIVAGGPKFVVEAGLSRHWSLGVMFDPYGFLGTTPGVAGRPNAHVCWNQPFFTTGLTDFVPLAGNPESGTTLKPFMGIDFRGTSAGAVDRNLLATRFQRVNSSGVATSGAIWDQRVISTFLLPFHHGAIPVGGLVRVTWPGNAKPTGRIGGNYFCAGTSPQGNTYTNPNLNTATDYTIWGIDYAGPTISNIYTGGGPGGGATYDSAGITSLATLIAAAPAGHKYWLDTANQIFWIAFKTHGYGYQWDVAP